MKTHLHFHLLFFKQQTDIIVLNESCSKCNSPGPKSGHPQVSLPHKVLAKSSSAGVSTQEASQFLRSLPVLTASSRQYSISYMVTETVISIAPSQSLCPLPCNGRHQPPPRMRHRHIQRTNFCGPPIISIGHRFLCKGIIFNVLGCSLSLHKSKYFPFYLEN